MLTSGTYGALTVSGLCMVAPNSTVTVNGPVTVGANGTLFAINSQTMTINGDVAVGTDAILALGCSPALGCDGSDHNPPSKDTVVGTITATDAKAMYLNGDTVNGDVKFSNGGWGKACTDPNADDPSDPLGHDLVVKDNTFTGTVTLDGWAGCWMGFIRNQVTGSVVITNNYANPANINNPGSAHPVKQGLDSTEIDSNTISGDLSCDKNTPAAQIGDSHGSFNAVVGAVTGECVPISTATAPACASAPFTDVAAASPFCGDIAWLSSQKIASGYADGSFGPARAVSREAMAAFLYRLGHGGADAPACASAPFTDVAAASPFCGDIAWLSSQKIASGYADGSFGPARAVSREAMVAFLYRLGHGGADAPACASAPFTDVAVANPFCGDIAWASSQRVSVGFADGKFHPSTSVTRQATAAMLYRESKAG